MKTKLILSLALASSFPLMAEPFKLEAGVEILPVEKADGEAKPPGFLGVTGIDLDETLAKQLELKHGVTLLSVSPDSPAGKAGLEKNDIITEVDGKPVETMEALRDAIRGHKAGEVAKLSLVQKGKRVEKKVTLGEAPVRAMIPEIRILPGIGGGLKGGGFFELGGRGGGMMRMGDANGSVEMKGQDEGREVTVRDHNDEIQFEGPWVTPQDKAAAPPEIRRRIDRVSKMGLGGIGGPRIEFDMIPDLLPFPDLVPGDVPAPGIRPAPAPVLPPIPIPAPPKAR